MTKDGVVKAAREAARLSRAARSRRKASGRARAGAVVKGTWMTPVTRDPLEVPIEEKVALLFATNEAALKVPGIRFVNSGLQLLREVKTYANSEGTETTQTFIRVGPSFSATAVGDGGFQQYRRSSRRAARAGSTSTSLDMPGNAGEWAPLAVEKLERAVASSRAATTSSSIRRTSG